MSLMSSALGLASGGSLGTLFVTLAADGSLLISAMEKAEASVSKSSENMMKQVTRLGTTTITALVGIGTVAVRQAMLFEDSFTGVRKTVQATEEEYKKLEATFRSLAKELPTSVNEINHIAEASGQLGIKKENIESFTRTIIDLGNTTNLVAEEGATAIARFANTIQMNQKQFSNLGSTLVVLGRDGASTEAEIVHMALRIAGAGRQINMTGAEILGFANSLSSVGVEAEQGGTAISQMMIIMAKSVSNGSATLKTFAEVAGKTVEEFTTQFKTNASGAIIDFLKGIRKIHDEGGNVYNVFETLGIDGIRMTDVLTRASSASDMFAHSLEIAGEAWASNSALADTAAKRYATFHSQILITWNLLKDMLITLGQEIIPVLKTLNNMLQDVTKSQDDANSTFSQFIKNVAPTLIKVFGTVGDAIWGWQLLMKAGQAAFLYFASYIINNWTQVATTLAKITETIFNKIIEGINWLIRDINKSLPKELEMPEIKFRQKFDMSAWTTTNQAFKEAYADTIKELDEMVAKGSFSERLAKEYKKVTNVIVEETYTAVEQAMTGEEEIFAKTMEKMAEDSSAVMKILYKLKVDQTEVSDAPTSLDGFTPADPTLRPEAKGGGVGRARYGEIRSDPTAPFDTYSGMGDLQEAQLQLKKLENLKNFTSMTEYLRYQDIQSTKEALDELNKIGQSGLLLSKSVQDERLKLIESYNAKSKALHEQELKAATQMSSEAMNKMLEDSTRVGKMLEAFKLPEHQSMMGTAVQEKGLGDPNVEAAYQMNADLDIARSRLKELEDLKNQELSLTKAMQAQKLAAIEAYNEKVRALQFTQNQMVFATSSKMFSDLSMIAATYAGEQSGIFQSMFAISKAFAIAESIIKIQQGIANAASLPFPSNLVAMGSVVAATANIVSSIQSVKLQLNGKREAGGPVEKGHLYMVGERGPELFVPDEDGNIVPNHKLNGDQAISNLPRSSRHLSPADQQAVDDADGAREGGGPVSAGNSYIVGEHGPELFTSKASFQSADPQPASQTEGGGIKVIINNYTDATASVTEKTDGDGKVLEVMIRRVKTEIGSDIRDGKGEVTRAMESTFNLRRGK